MDARPATTTTTTAITTITSSSSISIRSVIIIIISDNGCSELSKCAQFDGNINCSCDECKSQ